MVTIIFESHATTEDNEANIASGWYDVALSKTGESQAQELGQRYKNQSFDAIFCSDLQRSLKTAKLAFGDTHPIHSDKRLRECNYGDMNRATKTTVEAYKATAVAKAYPNGESYEDTMQRMKSFLAMLQKDYDNKTVMIIGHRATQYGLDHWISGKSVRTAVLDPWHWQPGWRYKLTALSS